MNLIQAQARLKIYRIDFHTADDGQMVAWAGSKKEAASVRRQFILENGPSQGVDNIKAVDVPTDKAGLIQWLNANLKKDNG